MTVLNNEIDQLRLDLAAARSHITPDERQFVLDLLRDARLHGILEIEYKALRLHLSPVAADNAQKQTYFVGHNSLQPVTGWETTLPKAR